MKSVIIIVSALLLVPATIWGQEMVIDTFYAYPNPFSCEDILNIVLKFTGQPHTASATLQVFDQVGDLVTTIAEDRQITSNIRVKITWDGLDENDERPNPGGYFIRLQIEADTGERISEIYKVVYLEDSK